METQENKLNKEPKLCVGRRFEGLIESASWVKSKRRGSLLMVGLMVAYRHGSFWETWTIGSKL